MSRTLKRVPMDFDWPLGKVWHGYQNPHHQPCPKCEDGTTVGRRYLTALVQLIMVAGEDGLRGRKHPWLYADPCPSEPPTADLAELTTGLAGRSMGPFGHDDSDRWKATDTIIRAAGLDPEKWGICQHCQGEAIDPAVKEAYEAWETFDPPAGDGFQLWETTSEGSPKSPVFATMDELCAWAEKNATTFGTDCFTTAAEWKRMLADDFVYHQDGNRIFA